MSSGQGGPDVEAALMRALEAGDMLDGALALAQVWEGGDGRGKGEGGEGRGKEEGRVKGEGTGRQEGYRHLGGGGGGGCED